VCKLSPGQGSGTTQTCSWLATPTTPSGATPRPLHVWAGKSILLCCVFNLLVKDSCGSAKRAPQHKQHHTSSTKAQAPQHELFWLLSNLLLPQLSSRRSCGNTRALPLCCLNGRLDRRVLLSRWCGRDEP
jgi:hypothetical protein